MGGLQGELRDGGRRGLAREIEEDGCGHGVAKASRGLLSQWPIAEVCDMVNSVTPRQGYYGMMSKVGGTEGILREMRTRSLAVGCVFLCSWPMTTGHKCVKGVAPLPWWHRRDKGWTSPLMAPMIAASRHQQGRVDFVLEQKQKV